MPTTASELYQAYRELVMKHSLDGTWQFGEYKAREDAARQRILDVDPGFFLRREAEAMVDARARYAA